MPINFVPLDNSASDENITILFGRNIVLKITEDQDSKLLLQDSLVQALVTNDNLLNGNTPMIIDELVKMDVENNRRSGRFSHVYGTMLNEIASDFALTVDTTWSIPVATKGTVTVADWKPFVKSEVDMLKKYDEKILELEEKVKKATNLELLEPATVFLCPKCEGILNTGEYRGKAKCTFCGTESTRSESQRLPVHRLNDKIRQVWKQGLWFEAYLAKVLGILGWTTWVQVHIIGASGVPHEIDVLAIKEGNVIVVEGKTGRGVTRRDVFNFLTKAQDLKVHLGVLALLTKLPEPETRDFVRKNRLLVVLEDMANITQGQAIEKLKNWLEF